MSHMLAKISYPFINSLAIMMHLSNFILILFS
uniref:Uncharacterized protein n=1 Tax=Arundo donax TaxID=35708 RepID=A0A0A9CH14_ARUDO